MTAPPESRLLLTAAQVRTDPWSEAAVPAILIDSDSGRIITVGEQALASAHPSDPRQDYPGLTLCPSLIDCHVHLVFKADGSPGESVIGEPKEKLNERCLKHARTALRAGVTTLADQGGPLPETALVRAASYSHAGVYASLRIAGSPITTPREHMWYFGGEARGETEVRTLSARLLNQSADFIKIVATGGGTAGSKEYEPTFSISELAAAVDVANTADTFVAVHASSQEGIARALAAGCKLIHHCNFYRPDGSRKFDPGLAEQIAQQNVAVDPTLWVTQSLIDRLRDGLVAGGRAQQLELERTEKRWAEKLVDIAGLIAAGVRIVAGSDAGWQFAQFDETWCEVQALADAGLSPQEAYAASTTYAAESLQVADDVGRLHAGCYADLLVLRGDPTSDIRHLARPAAVYHHGSEVDRRKAA
jgi:imidazolonepropionase-like amidohydrolase